MEHYKPKNLAVKATTIVKQWFVRNRKEMVGLLIATMRMSI